MKNLKNLIGLMFLVIVLNGCAIGQTTVTRDFKQADAIATKQEEQKAIIDSSKNELQETDYTIDNPYLVVDPFTLNSLSGYVAFDIDEPATYSYTVVGHDDESNYTQTSDEEQSNVMIIPVIGLYAGEANNVEITINYEDGSTIN